jgi:Family of unknown function (DUF5670)
MTVKSTARGMGLRALLLIIGGLLLAGWLIGVAMKIAGAAIHFLAVAAIVLIVGAFIVHKVRSFRAHP